MVCRVKAEHSGGHACSAQRQCRAARRARRCPGVAARCQGQGQKQVWASCRRKLLPRRPDLKVIFISGYAEDTFRRNLDPDSEFELLPKPFSLKQLAGRVKDVIGS